MPMKVMKILLLDLEKQGCVTKETKAGYLIFFPNGESTCIHKTPSDVRVIRNIRATIRRAGLIWPLEGNRKVA